MQKEPVYLCLGDPNDVDYQLGNVIGTVVEAYVDINDPGSVSNMPCLKIACGEKPVVECEELAKAPAHMQG